jgi:N-acetylglucosamine-6-sulfatase
MTWIHSPNLPAPAWCLSMVGVGFLAAGCQGGAPRGASDPHVPGASVPASPVAEAEPAGVGRPNVLVLLADDLRYDGLSGLGNRWIETPHLDRIASEGVVFERAYVTTSRCCPSRASFLTGRYAHVHGVFDNVTPVDFQAEHPTYPEVLQAAGYRTGYIGKWHIPSLGIGPGPRPGFDRWISYEGGGHHFDEVFNVDGETVASTGYQADVLTDRAIEFVQEEGTDEPFLLVVGFKNPHGPLEPAPRHLGALEGAALALPDSAEDPLETLLPLYRRLRQQRSSQHAIGDPASFLEDCRRYWELVLSIDDNVGRLLAALEASGELDRTVVIFTSDNGQLLGEHGLRQKGVAYEPSIRIPLAVRFPSVARGGGRVQSAALNVDLFPTLMELCGVEHGLPLDGVSLVPQLEDPGAPGREAFLYAGPRFSAASERAVVGERWKYVRIDSKRGAQEALFDLVHDPDERINVIGEASNAAVVERLGLFMDAESERLGL